MRGSKGDESSRSVSGPLLTSAQSRKGRVLALLPQRDPAAPPAHVQDHIIFTYDDLGCAQNVVQLVPPPPNRIVSIREARYKLARYYDGDGIEPDQWEMYALDHDPEERVNLAVPGTTLSAEQSAARERLTAKLREGVATRLQPQ